LNGFKIIEKDHYVYTKRSSGSFTILSLYVDNILLASNNLEMLLTVKKWFSSAFEIKDIGEANFVLNIKILRDHFRELLSLSQEIYIKKILK